MVGEKIGELQSSSCAIKRNNGVACLLILLAFNSSKQLKDVRYTLDSLPSQ